MWKASTQRITIRAIQYSFSMQVSSTHTPPPTLVTLSKSKEVISTSTSISSSSTYTMFSPYIGRVSYFVSGTNIQFSRAFTDAGYLVGVTVRPQYLNYTEGFQREVPDEQAVQLVIDKIAYAKQRWGARLFYMDSNGDPSNPTSGVLMRRVFLEHPDILFMPESQTPVYYSFSAPFENIRYFGW